MFKYEFPESVPTVTQLNPFLRVINRVQTNQDEKREFK